ncbi:MAG: hypothetical protein E4H14_18560 [Candidatus Thorarchaeota archaeon]|nr:MAG: hypothetical protein E4H14_18560 [Candidatus Thorarchaeota archaeon]
MSEKIYVISCSQDLISMGIDRMRSSCEGLEEIELSLDWTNTRLIPVVAAEKVSFQKGETKLVPIKPIDVPAFAMVIQSFYGINGMGDLGCIGCTEMKLYFEDRQPNMSMFSSRIKASVLPGDLLGQVLVVNGKKK